jgi:hypothetical protein
MSLSDLLKELTLNFAAHYPFYAQTDLLFYRPDPVGIL